MTHHLDPRNARSLAELVAQRAEQTPDRRIFTFITSDGEEETLTYREWDARARAVAHALREHGIKPGSRAMLLYPAGLEFMAGFFGCIYAGVIPVQGPYPTRPFRRAAPRMRSILADCAPSIAVLPSAVADRIPDLIAAIPELASLQWLYSDRYREAPSDFELTRVDRDAIAFLQYTSGSTSTPKGVIVSHGNVFANCKAVGQGSDVKTVSWLPMVHDCGLIYGAMQPLYDAAESILMAPAYFLQRPVRWLRAVTKHRGTHSIAPNFAYDLCVRTVTEADKAELDLSSFEEAMNAAEPVRRETIERFATAFAGCGLRPTSLVAAYGLAEHTLYVTRTPRGKGAVYTDLRNADLEAGIAKTTENEESTAFVGHGLDNPDSLTIAIVDPSTLRRCASDRIGEIWLKSACVAQGYWGREAESEATFRARTADGEGPFLRTGDLGFIQNGELFITGRLKDMIILHGRNHYPQDIELTTERSHPGIVPHGVAAFALEEHGEEVIGLVVEVEKKVDVAEVVNAIRKAITDEHEVAVHTIVLIDPRSILKTTSGKIQRSACRAAYQRNELAVVHKSVLGQLRAEPSDAKPKAAAEISCESIEQTLLPLIVNLFRRNVPPKIQPNDVLSTVGFDSVMAAELSGEIHARWGVELSPGLFFDATPRKLAEKILEEAVGPSSSRRPRSVRLKAAPAVAPDPEPVNVCSAKEPKKTESGSGAAGGGLDFSLFYFADAHHDDANAYEVLLETARIGDRLGFKAIWLPERHFHPFGGICPNPSVLAAAVSQVTSRLRIRAGSVILPLHNPVRVAEEWALIDNLSGGRVDIAFGTGWNANDFVLAPDDFTRRRDITFSRVGIVQGLWRGEAVSGPNGKGEETTFRAYPRPIQRDLNTWFTCTGGAEGFMEAGANGYNVLTALLFQSADDLAAKIALYRAARERNGHDPNAGTVTVMLHTFVGTDFEYVKRKVREPFLRYLKSSVNLWKQESLSLASLTPKQRDEALEFAFERYFQTAALFGTPETCAPMVEKLRGIGANEIACLVDFGLDAGSVISGVRDLDRLRTQFRNPASAPARYGT